MRNNKSNFSGGLKRISDGDEDKKWITSKPCLSPEHNPPSHIVLQPGTYEYTCPSCGTTMRFTIPYIT